MDLKITLVTSLAVISLFAATEHCSARPKRNTALPPTYSYFVDGSFIYWYAKEDGLTLARNSVIISTGAFFLADNGQVLNSDFSYSPGFKVAAGMKAKEWCLFAEYTWLRPRNSTSSIAPQSTPALPTGIGIWAIESWFLQTNNQGGPLAGSQINSKWNLDLDMLDLLGGNPIYKGSKVNVAGVVGLRTAFIHQTLDIDLFEVAATVGGFLPPQPVHSQNSSHSWGIGPKIGFNTQYYLPIGFRLEGMLASSLLYTRFSDIKHFEDRSSTVAPNSSGVSDEIDSYAAVRPVLELGLGFGWRSNWSDSVYGIDFSARYDFSIFWGQNVMRPMLDEFLIGVSSNPGDLYFHGMTLTSCFNF